MPLESATRVNSTELAVGETTYFIKLHLLMSPVENFDNEKDVRKVANTCFERPRPQEAAVEYWSLPVLFHGENIE